MSRYIRLHVCIELGVIKQQKPQNNNEKTSTDVSELLAAAFRNCQVRCHHQGVEIFVNTLMVGVQKRCHKHLKYNICL